MANKTIITCAVTGSITRPEQHPDLPITPEQIAEPRSTPPRPGRRSPISTCATRRPARRRWSSSSIARWSSGSAQRQPDLIINLTTGPGGRFMPGEDDPKIAAPARP